MTDPRDLESMFPRLAEFGYEITSPDTGIYNCIAWAAQDQTAWWWPRASFYGPGVMGGSYWPETLPSGATISNFVEMFVQLGYENCETGDLEAGFEKVALYALRGSPTHAARQLPDGLWTSKLGRWNDVTHRSPEGVESETYGQVTVFLKRRRPIPHRRKKRA